MTAGLASLVAADPIAATLAGCPHFGACGGCTDIAPKTGMLPRALTAAGFADLPEISSHRSPPGARRRMDLAVRRHAAGAIVGLHRHRSHDIVDLHQCAVLHPDLASLFSPLRTLLPRLDALRRDGSVIANRLDDGIDLLLRTDAAASRADREKLAELARGHGIARISHAIGAALPEPLAMLHRPAVTLSGVRVCPPPGAFLQATRQGEAAIVAAVLAGLPRRSSRRDRVAELFCGIGTLTFAIAAEMGVDAYEGDPAALAALDRACRDAALLGRIVPRLRDLARQPLQAAELAGLAAVVLDPPAGGALAQMREIAAARVARVIYVSCDPHSLTRDAGILRQAGYRLQAATAIDQFIGATRLESVCVFDAPRPPRRG